MRVWLGRLGLLTTCAILPGCDDNGQVADPEPQADMPVSDDGSPGSLLYDPTRVTELRLEVSEESLATLRSDADQPMGFEDFSYVSARLSVDGAVYEEVGLRVKGNNSRVSAQGNAVPLKLDMNRFVKGQKLDGETKINLHNNANQGHAMSDYLSYAAFRAAGVAASRTGWADVWLNDEKLGLYTLVEQVDEKMLARHYDEPSADLYKPEPAAGRLTYAGDSIEDYPQVGYEADNETDHATFLRLVQSLENEPVSSWDEVIDVGSVLVYLAGNVALGNWDTYTAMGHNYYLFEATKGRFVMLPWDMNLSQAASSAVCPADVRMGQVGGAPGLPTDGGAFGSGMMGARPSLGAGFPTGFPGGDAAVPTGVPGGLGGPGGFGGGAPLYDGLITNPDYYARYREVLQSFLAGPGSSAALKALVDEGARVLGERVATSALDQLRATIDSRVAALESALPNTESCSAVGDGAMSL